MTTMPLGAQKKENHLLGNPLNLERKTGLKPATLSLEG
jgi:hypothetical protein